MPSEWSIPKRSTSGRGGGGGANGPLIFENTHSKAIRQTDNHGGKNERKRVSISLVRTPAFCVQKIPLCKAISKNTLKNSPL
jgi:hypothetical protein